MKFEHFALNVADAAGQARWYAQQLGFKVVRARTDAPHTHFLADASGRVVVEFYSNPKAPLPDYAAQHPLVLHLGLATADARTEAKRLREAGATAVAEEALPDGSLLIMLRDPWGLALQLCQRADPMPMP